VCTVGRSFAMITFGFRRRTTGQFNLIAQVIVSYDNKDLFHEGLASISPYLAFVHKFCISHRSTCM